MGILFSVGILLPGSDFDGFPWVNIIGLICLAMVALLAQRATRPPRLSDWSRDGGQARRARRR